MAHVQRLRNLEYSTLSSSEWPSFHDLLIAYKNCRLHKPANSSQIRFEQRLGENLIRLHRAIHSGTYKPAPAKCFVVTQPKPREIFAAEFRDRVVHHLVVSRLEPLWERKFIHASFACRKRKGSHGAIRWAQKRVRELSHGGIRTVWSLQLDVAKFFVTINRPILTQLLLSDCNDPKLRKMIWRTYSHDARIGVKRSMLNFDLIPPGKSWFDQLPEQGIPIGNLSSQFGANVYLTGLDHFIQRILKPKAYLRYMDDLLLLDDDPEKLKTMIQPIDTWLLQNRKQQLNPNKTLLTVLSDGISYLGYRLKQMDSASMPLQIFSEPKKKWDWITSIHHFETTPLLEFKKPHALAPLLPSTHLQKQIASLNARLGSLVHSRSYLLRKESLEHFISRTTESYGEPKEHVDPWCPYKLKKDYRAVKLK